MNLLTEIPGFEKRIVQLEEYVYSGQDYEYKPRKMSAEERMPPLQRIDSSSEETVAKAKKVTKTVPVAKADLFRPNIEKGSKAQDIEDYMDDFESDESRGKFHIVAQSVALVQDMAKEKIKPPHRKGQMRVEYEDDDYLYEEQRYERAPDLVPEEFGEQGKSSSEVSSEYSDFKIKTVAFTSHDVLEEHSLQLKGQIIMYVKKQLEAFQVDMQKIEGDLISVRKSNEFLDKNLKELSEKLACAETNFSLRAGELVAVKEVVGKLQVSIVTITHHMDRKAEAYDVNLKVSRKELTLIEDRVVKLCATTSSDITKLTC